MTFLGRAPPFGVFVLAAVLLVSHPPTAQGKSPSEPWRSSSYSVAPSMRGNLSVADGPILVGGQACAQWNVTGTWQVTQNNGFGPTFTFIQNGTNLTGTGLQPAADVQRSGYSGNTGTLVGTVTGNQMDFRVTWAPFRNDAPDPARRGTTQTGRYLGTVVASAIINGDAYDLAYPNAHASWTATGPSSCIGTPQPPASPPAADSSNAPEWTGQTRNCSQDGTGSVQTLAGTECAFDAIRCLVVFLGAEEGGQGNPTTGNPVSGPQACADLATGGSVQAGALIACLQDDACRAWLPGRISFLLAWLPTQIDALSACLSDSLCRSFLPSP
jgi:hypothetical protein